MTNVISTCSGRLFPTVGAEIWKLCGLLHFYPCNTMQVKYKLLPGVYFSVCLSHNGIVLKWLNRSSQLLTIFFINQNEVLPFETLSRNLRFWLNW